MMKRTLILVVLLVTACATQQPIQQPAAKPCRASDATINSTLWMQTSGEYQALVQQAYGTAAQTLAAALADPSWTAATEQAQLAASMPPAIIVDIDETVLDTSDFQTSLIRAGVGYSDERWQQFEQSETSAPIPGALEFLRTAQKSGVTIFYITNRKLPEEAGVRRVLEKFGFPLDLSQDTVLMRGERPEWPSRDKSSRRAFVASRYRVIMLFGDDLNDFVNAEGKPIAERAELVRQNADKFGRKWFVLPNPVYGSWERSAVGPNAGSDCEQFQKKLDLLRPAGK